MDKQSLCKAIDSIQSAGDSSLSVFVQLGPEYAHLAEAYETWQMPGNDPMIYILDHEYTEASFSVKSLNGSDRAKVEASGELA